MTSETNHSQPHRGWASSPTVLDRKTVFQGAIFNIDRAQVRLHDGRITHRQIVTKADGAIAIPITSRGTLIMVIQHRVGLLDSLVHPDCQVYEFQLTTLSSVNNPSLPLNASYWKKPATPASNGSMPAIPPLCLAMSPSWVTAFYVQTPSQHRNHLLDNLRMFAR